MRTQGALFTTSVVPEMILPIIHKRSAFSKSSLPSSAKGVMFKEDFEFYMA